VLVVAIDRINNIQRKKWLTVTVLVPLIGVLHPEMIKTTRMATTLPPTKAVQATEETMVVLLKMVEMLRALSSMLEILIMVRSMK
jgi:hypothetical protein